MEIGTIHIVLTTYCNLGCKGCYQEDKEILNKQEDFKLEDHKDNIRFLYDKFKKENKQIKISFFGGEPLIKTNTIKEISLYLKDELLIPDIISIPTSGGPNQNLIQNGLELIKFLKQLFPITKLNLSLSHDGPNSFKTRNQDLNGLITSFTTIKKMEKEIGNFTPPTVLNLLPQRLEYEDELSTIDNYINCILNKDSTFRIPHLLDIDSNLDSEMFQKACRYILSTYIDLDPILLPKIFKDYYDRMIQPIPEKNRDYNWCQAGVNHFALTNIKGKTFTGCEYLNKDSLTLYNQMMVECNSCSINNYCSKPCLKSIEVGIEQFKRHCTIRKILFNEVRYFINKKLIKQNLKTRNII